MAQMRRVSSNAINKRLAPVGTSMQAYKVLFRLVHHDEVPQHELAWDAAMDPGAVSRLIRGLVKEGLVTTRVDPTDKRQRFVRITPKGRELERSLSPVIDAALEPFENVLTKTEQDQLLALMQKACEGVIAKAQEAMTLPPPRKESVAPRPKRRSDARAPKGRSVTARRAPKTASR